MRKSEHFTEEFLSEVFGSFKKQGELVDCAAHVSAILLASVIVDGECPTDNVLGYYIDRLENLLIKEVRELMDD